MDDVQVRPDALGATVTLNSVEKVDAALAEIVWLKSRSAAEDAALEACYLELQKQLAPRRLISIGKSETTLSERTEYLQSLVDAWAVDNLKAYLPEASKTLKLKHGSIAVKDDPPALKLYEGWKDDDVLDAMDNELQFVDAINKVAKEPYGEQTIGDFIRITPAVNRARLLELHKAGTITDEDLGPFGLMRKESSESFKVKAA